MLRKNCLLVVSSHISQCRLYVTSGSCCTCLCTPCITPTPFAYPLPPACYTQINTLSQFIFSSGPQIYPSYTISTLDSPPSHTFSLLALIWSCQLFMFLFSNVFCRLEVISGAPRNAMPHHLPTMSLSFLKLTPTFCIQS